MELWFRLMKRFTVAVALLATVSSLLAITPSQATPTVTIVAATPVDHYNSVTVFNPVTRKVKFFRSQDLTNQTLPNKNWISQATPFTELDAPDEQGVYNVCTDACEDVAPLIVDAVPGHPSAEVLVVVPDFTWQAYSPTGGGSLYGSSPQNPRLPKQYPFGRDAKHPYGQHSKSQVSVLRPLEVTLATENHFDEVPANNPIEFLRAHGFEVDVVSQTNLEKYDYKLNQYKTVVLFGHDEYWTKSYATKLISAVKAGTNLLNLSGNTGHRRIIFKNNVISFEQNSKNQDLSELPQNSSNPILDLLGQRYVFYPLSRKIGESTRPFNQIDYETLLRQGFPQSVIFENALAKTNGFQLSDVNTPLFRDVVPDADRFVGAESSVAKTELDGVPMSASGKVMPTYTKSLGLAQADILATVWPSFSLTSSTERSSRAGTLVAKYFGKGRVISVGTMGWLGSILSDDSNIRQLTLNFLSALQTNPADATSSFTASTLQNTLKHWNTVGTVQLGEHESASTSATCFKGSKFVPCKSRISGTDVQVQFTSPVTKIKLQTTVIGGPGYKILVKPKILTANLTVATR